ncbi:hypothetical protein BS47DRAFT_1361958 [Hydnum rufescens UP504]|uniref:Uncharacterized protein n=1 Tax=Hydnum rufescens UP504 TaxID=1448309 RepID=A0A9P6AZC9_9AGAM|nr:hypothetical protein BS47DRAFT_1361958 [Hydnum rufescens UP504]
MPLWQQDQGTGYLQGNFGLAMKLTGQGGILEYSPSLTVPRFLIDSCNSKEFVTASLVLIDWVDMSTFETLKHTQGGPAYSMSQPIGSTGQACEDDGIRSLALEVRRTPKVNFIITALRQLPSRRLLSNPQRAKRMIGPANGFCFYQGLQQDPGSFVFLGKDLEILPLLSSTIKQLNGGSLSSTLLLNATTDANIDKTSAPVEVLSTSSHAHMREGHGGCITRGNRGHLHHLLLVNLSGSQGSPMSDSKVTPQTRKLKDMHPSHPNGTTDKVETPEITKSRNPQGPSHPLYDARSRFGTHLVISLAYCNPM